MTIYRVYVIIKVLTGQGEQNPTTERQGIQMKEVESMTNKQSDELKTLYAINVLHNLLENEDLDAVARRIIKEKIKVLNADLTNQH